MSALKSILIGLSALSSFFHPHPSVKPPEIKVVPILHVGGTGQIGTSVTPFYATSSNMLLATDTSSIPNAGRNQVNLDLNVPKMTLSKYSGEASLGFQLQGLTASGTPPTLGNTMVTWSNAAETMQVIPIATSTQLEDGGYEINIVLNAKPPSNVFNFAVTGWQDFDFYYQAPLWQSQGLLMATPNCTDTDCTTAFGEVMHRPAEIVGTYAVYYKKKDYCIKGCPISINHGSGKAFHILKPIVTDALGATTTATLLYTPGNLAVTVPPGFYSSSTLPVIIDPTFGKTAHGASTNTFQADYIEASHYTLSVSGAVVTKITAYVDNNGASPTAVKGVIYNQSASKPLTLQANSAGVSLAAGAGAAEIDYVLSCTLNAAEYWLGLDNQTANGRFYYDDGAANSSYFFTAAGTYTTPPTTWSDFANPRTRLQTNYATYTVPTTGGAFYRYSLIPYSQNVYKSNFRMIFK